MKLNHSCKECGAMEDGLWADDVARVMQDRCLCYECNFWVTQIETPGIVIDGAHYRVGRGGTRGFGGRWFDIVMDGGTIHTNDLWCQGEIPGRFRDRLPDNAVWGRK